MRLILAPEPSTRHLVANPFSVFQLAFHHHLSLQQKNFELLGIIPNVHIVFDDIIIAATDDIERNAA